MGPSFAASAILSAQQTGHERETALKTDLLGIYSGTADADKAKAEEIARRLDAAVTTAKGLATLAQMPHQLRHEHRLKGCGHSPRHK